MTNPILQRALRVRRPWYAPWRRIPLADSNVDMRQGRAIIASAARLVAEKIKGGSQRRAEQWMAEAWQMYDLVGELHFLATTLARRASRARFYVGKVDGTDVAELATAAEVAAGDTDEQLDASAPRPTPKQLANDKKAQKVFDSLGDGFIGVQEIVERAFVNQFTVGACYLVGAPKEVWKPVAGRAPRPIKTVPVNELVWRTLSVTEFVPMGETYELKQNGSAADSKDKTIKIAGNAVYVISLWNPHPADSSVPDSPVRAALPILRELVGLTQHISAQIDSRLAGAGMLVMRSSHSRALKRALGIPEDDPRDPFTELLITAMVTPIGDRDSASAVVPYVTTIPDGSEKPEYISFSAPLDQYAGPLREESIRRVALSLDAPPELLLGQGTTSHWTAWLTQEEVVDSHISPTLALIARGLTTEFLRPILRANGLTIAEAEQYAIWFDTSELTVKANLAADAKELHAMGLLSDEAVRRAVGFDESDAPKKADVKEQAIDMVKEMVIANPGLINRPGLKVMVEQLTAFLEGNPLEALSAAVSAAPGAEPVEPVAKPGEDLPTGAEVASPTGEPPAPVVRPLRAPVTTVTTPGIPQTRAAAAAEADVMSVVDDAREMAMAGGGDRFGKWDHEK